MGPRAINHGRGVEKTEGDGATEDRCKGTKQLENLARPDPVDLRRRSMHPMSDCVVLEGEGGPSGSPHHVEDFDPSHHFAAIPTASGATSTA